MINFGLIGLTFGALMLLRHLSSVSETVKKSSFLRIVLLNFFNRMIWNILRTVMELEENKTKTEYVVSVMNKSYLAQSFNIIVQPIIMFCVLQDKLDAVDGLSGAVHDYQITAFIFMFFFNCANVPYRVLRLIVLIPCTLFAMVEFLVPMSSRPELDWSAHFRNVRRWFFPLYVFFCVIALLESWLMIGTPLAHPYRIMQLAQVAIGIIGWVAVSERIHAFLPAAAIVMMFVGQAVFRLLPGLA